MMIGEVYQHNGSWSNCDPRVAADVSWKTFIGQHSGESYQFEWVGNQGVTVVLQPSERRGGISVSVD